MSNFDLSAFALKCVAPNNEIIYDDKGLPSVMVKLPKQTYAQLGLGASTDIYPAWIVGGVTKDFIYFPKFQNIVSNGRAYSLPGEDPQASITLDTANSRATAKGAGWHGMTYLEWMAVALWCKKNGTMPKGNNNYGKDATEATYRAIPTYYSGENIGRVATGTGPVTWSHDGTVNGIYDLNGNVNEWTSGIRTVSGELQVLSADGVHIYNDAANPDNSQPAASNLWYAIDGTTGELVTPNGSGTTSNALRLDWLSGAWKWTTGVITGTPGQNGCTFENVSVDAGVGAAAIAVLQMLGMYKFDMTAGAYGGDYFYADNSGSERCFVCGGGWTYSSNAGVFCRYGYYSRSYSDTDIGFRAAYIES